jgi:hypothetical protein
LSSALFFVGCTHDDEPDLKMLETRADYGAAEPGAETLALGTAAAQSGDTPVPLRIPPRIVHIWMHASETPEHEYFWGAWLSVVVSGEEWGISYGKAAGAPSRGSPSIDRKE